MKSVFFSLKNFQAFQAFLRETQRDANEIQIFPPVLIPSGPFWIILIRAGSASLGFFDPKKKMVLHKRISAYMTRKKQGKAQLTYLKTKGKSRAGSRYRLRESRDFFEAVNQKLTLWMKGPQKPEKIYYLCPVGLIHEWFSGKIRPPFEKKDARLLKIPFHLGKPTHEELKKALRLLTAFRLSSLKETFTPVLREFQKWRRTQI